MPQGTNMAQEQSISGGSAVGPSHSLSSEMEPKVFNDPVHGHMEFHPFLVKIIDTPEFQRLRQIKQLGGAYFVYPGASHNRFEHSLGVAHLAGQLVRNLKEKQPELGIDDRDILCVEIAGLCHDLGHGPFSHLFDGMFMPKVPNRNGWKHEEMSIKMFDYIVKKLKPDFDLESELKKLSENTDGDDLCFIKEMINGPNAGGYTGRPSKPFLYEIVANKRTGIDVDKFDYFARDCHHLGIKNSFDHNRYIKFARVIEVEEVREGQEVKEKQICIRDKELSNIYEMFHTRSSLYRKAYQHKTKMGIELMITDALLKADKDEEFNISTNIEEEYVKLTDGIFEKILHSNNTSLEVTEARTILENILTRKLYPYLGEFKMTDKLASKFIKEGKLENLTKADFGTIEQGLKTELSDEIVLPEDFEIMIATFDFGNKDKNPMDNLYVYKKSAKDKARKTSEEEVSQFLMPKQFSEKWIRVYCRSWDKKKTAQENFDNWCQRNASFLSSNVESVSLPKAQFSTLTNY